VDGEAFSRQHARSVAARARHSGVRTVVQVIGPHNIEVEYANGFPPAIPRTQSAPRCSPSACPAGSSAKATAFRKDGDARKRSVGGFEDGKLNGDRVGDVSSGCSRVPASCSTVAGSAG